MWWVWKPQIKLYIHIQHLRLFQTMLNGESWEPRERCLPPRTCLPFLGLASTRPRSASPTSTLPTDPSHGHPSKPPALPHSSREEFCFLFTTLAPTAGEHLEARCKRHQIWSLGRALPIGLQKFWESCGSHGPAADLTEHWGWLISIAQNTEYKAFIQHKEWDGN